MSENISSTNRIESDKHFIRSQQVHFKHNNNNFIGKLVSKDNILLISDNNIQIGRRCSKSEVDFQIGKNKFVSRKHLLLTYDEKNFLLTCTSKNGIFVDGIFKRFRIDMPQLKLPKSCVLRFPNTNIRLHFESFETQNLNISVQENEEMESMDSLSINTDKRQFNQNCTLSYLNGTERPPGSYGQFIIEAIQAAPEKKLKLSEIYSYITDKYCYFRTIPKNGWQNSIRHNLSLYPHFVRIPDQDSSKGSSWKVDEALLNKKLLK
ncbi:unnamed protein product [Diamesa serratosioi]